MIKRSALCALLLLALCTGCKRQKEIALDDRHALSLAPDVQWAVVKEPYVTYRADKSWAADTGGYERKGEILQVLGKSEGEGGEMWYLFENGYLPASALTIEGNRYRAERTAQMILQ